MDFNLKQWSEQEHEHEHESESDEQQQQQQNKCAKIPKQMFLETPNQQLEVAALPLFVSSNNNQPNKITATPPAVPTSTSKFPWVGERYSFSITQWQELELQALIYRHMVAGASIPPELLQLVKRSLFTCSTPPPFYLHQYSPHFQPPVAAAWYWGKGAMDPEPGRCRRTDGKKWRCSRDVVAGHKYCERHMHRGRNRSRKPVEFPAAASTSTADTLYKSSPTTGFASGSVCADTQFSLSRSGNSSPLDAFQLNPRCRTSDKNTLLGTQLESSSTTIYGDNSKNNNRVLMHFFDDYPRSGDTDGSMASSTTTSLSMSTPGNSSSDFLRLSTGTGNEAGPRGGRNGNGNDDGERDQHISWSAGGWGANPVGSMGGPLAEALRSSSNSSPTSVLHQLPRCSAPDTSFISV